MENYTLAQWNFNIAAIHHGERDTLASNGIDQHPLASYTETFAKLSYSPIRALELFLQGKNLNDREYTTPALNGMVSDGVPGRGSEWLLGGEYHF